MGGEPTYDVPAEGYDELYGEEQAAKYAAAFKSLQRLLDEPRVVLDVGCATGLLAEFLEHLGLNHLYIGIDLDADRLRIAKSRSPSIMVVQADAHALPVRSGAADLTACFTVIHLLDLERAIRELARASRSTMIITLLRKKLELKPMLLRLLKENLRGWNLESPPVAEDVKDELYILVRRDRERALRAAASQESSGTESPP